MQTDNLRAVRLVVSLSLNFTTRRTAHKLRLTAALCEKREYMLMPMNKRQCPKCSEDTISRGSLFIQALCIPGYMCVCSNCQSIVHIKRADSIIKDIVMEFIIVLFVLVAWWYLGSAYLGIAIFLAWRLFALFLKTGSTLEAVE